MEKQLLVREQKGGGTNITMNEYIAMAYESVL
jgi:hypothetical protein